MDFWKSKDFYFTSLWVLGSLVKLELPLVNGSQAHGYDAFLKLFKLEPKCRDFIRLMINLTFTLTAIEDNQVTLSS